MWCMNCGTQLPGEAKFCFKCGTKIGNPEMKEEEIINIPNNSSLESKNNKKEVVIVDRDVELTLLERKFTYKESDATYSSIEKAFNKIIKEAKTSFINRFDKQYKTLGALIDNAEDDFNKDLYKGVVFVKELLTFITGQEVSAQDLYNEFSEICYEFSRIIYEADEYYYKVMGQLDDSKSHRENRKNYRGRWQGGGFGVGGAIKGAATAGTMNAASGIMYSLFNGVGNISSNYQANKAIDEYYNNPNLKESLIIAIEQDLITLKNFAVESFGLLIGIKFSKDLYTAEKFNKSIAIYNDLSDGKIPKDKLEESVLEMLTLYPLDEDYYYMSFKRYRDDIEGIDEFAKFFQISLEKVRITREKEIAYDNAIDKNLGKARPLLDRDLGENLIYEREVGNFTHNLVANVSLADGYFEDTRLLFIYDSIEQDVKNAFNVALENYLDYEDETPLVFYNNSTSIVKSEGFVITNKTLITLDVNKNRIIIPINNINKVELEGNKLRINSTEISISMINNDDFEVLREIIEFTIFTIKHSKALNNNQEPIVKDKLNLKNKYFQYINVVEKNVLEEKLGEAVDIFESKLKRNRVYNEHKGRVNKISTLDVKSIIKQYKGDNLYFIDEEVSVKVIDKIDNVYSTYAKEKIESETEYVLFDNTIWGGAKEGFLITEAYIYVHNAYEEAFKIKISDVEDVVYKEEELYINGIKVSVLHVPNEEKYNFKNIIEYILYRVKYKDMINANEETSIINEANTRYTKEKVSVNVDNSSINEEFMNEIKSIKTENDFLAYLKKYVSSTRIPVMCTRIYVNGESQSVFTKFNAALAAYFAKAPEELPCIIYDDTMFGSAKDGFILTSHAIHFRNAWETPVKIEYTDVKNIKSDGKYLIIGRNKIELNYASKNEMEELAKAITELIEVIKAIRVNCF